MDLREFYLQNIKEDEYHYRFYDDIENVNKEYNQRDYFPFYDYEYELDITKQKTILLETTSLYDGLKESYNWYKDNKDEVKKKNYFEFIDKNLR